MLFTCVDWLTNYCSIYLVLLGRELNASSVAKLFFYNIVRFFGVPAEVISGRDPGFTAFFR